MIVIRDPCGRERRIQAGPGGATRAVLERAAASPGLYLGSLALLGEGERVLARFPRTYWQPESPGDEPVYDAGHPADDAAAFAAATGLPVTDARSTGHTGEPRRTAHGDLPGRDAGRGHGQQQAVVSYRTTLPAWFLAARALLAAVAAGGYIYILLGIPGSSGSGRTGHAFGSSGGYQATALICGAAALLQPLLAGVLFARAWWLDRLGSRALPEPAARLAPHPAGAESRRFLRTASLRLFPGDIVVTGEGAEERWLPRAGPTGVVELVRVTVHGRPSRLELRTADGRPRAVLPWQYWFAGAGGEQALAGFAAAVGLPLREAEGKHVPDDAETLWQYRPLRLGSASATADYLRWQGLPGVASLGLATVLGLFSALVGLGSPSAFGMGLAAIVLAVGAWYARRLARRRMDRPAGPAERHDLG